MKRLIFILLVTLLYIPTCLYSAEIGYKLHGTVSDENSKPIIGATITLKELSKGGSVSDVEGGYSIELSEGEYNLEVNYLGCETFEKKIDVTRDLRLDITLKSGEMKIDEVVVSSISSREKLKSVEIGVEKIDIATMAKMPALLGENDIVKSLTLLPGVKSDGDGSSGFQVRGGTSSQNLILLDDAPVYNSGHVMGLFSVFNDDVVGSANLYKGQIPSVYGGATSAVLDVETKNSKIDKFSAGINVGLLSSKAFIQTPIVKEKLSVFVAARRTYFDLFLKLTKEFKDNTFNFYDVNARVDYAANENNNFSLSYFIANDKMGLEDMMNMGWGNSSVSFKWVHKYGDKLFSRTSLIHSAYDADAGISAANIYCAFDSFIKNSSLKHNFVYTPNSKHTLQFGVQTTWVDLLSAQWQYNDATESERRQSWDNSLWVNEQWKITPKLDVMLALRFNAFLVMGGNPYYNLDKDGALESVRYTKKGEVVDKYFELEPRASINYQISDFQSLKAGYSRSSQNIFALRNSTMSMPFDRYGMTSNILKPQTANQVSLGYIHLTKDNMYEFSVEGYYKSIDNVYDYKDGKSFNSDIKLETIVLGGEGRAYGAEFLVKKSVGKFTGWIGYTLSWVENKIEGINGGQWYTGSNDIRHDLTAVAMVQLKRGWNGSANFIYNTGQALSAPSAKYEMGGETVYYYAEKNGYRAPSYNRLDVSFIHTKVTPKYIREWNIGVFNLYNRYNPYMISFVNDDTKPSGTATIQYSLFGIIPSVSYSITF